MLEAGESITVRTSRDIGAIISNLKIDSTMVQGRTDRVQTIVSWRTDEPAVSIVEYEGSAKAGGIDKQSGKYGNLHDYAHYHHCPAQTRTLYQVRVSPLTSRQQNRFADTNDYHSSPGGINH